MLITSHTWTAMLADKIPLSSLMNNMQMNIALVYQINKRSIKPLYPGHRLTSSTRLRNLGFCHGL